MIRKMLEPSRDGHPLIRVGYGDDCAIIGDFAISTDASIDEVHFRRDWLGAEEIGWRAAAAAVSDLAAVAAEPVAVLVSLAMRQGDTGEYAASLMQGVIAAAESVGATVVGGDTSQSSQLMVDVIAVGKATKPALRSHAKPGDEIWVTGTLGGSAAAVQALLERKTPSAAARVRYAHPLARTAESLWLRDRDCMNAAIDLSDGLYGDLRHIAAASACGLIIDTNAVPIDRDAGATFEQAASGGEDYEIAFTAPAGIVEKVRDDFIARFKIELTRIGIVAQGSGVQERLADGQLRPAEFTGYQHFKARA